MDEFQSINEIISESIRNSSYTAAIISSVVFIVYTAIVKIIDYLKGKQKDKPLIEMSKAMREITVNVAKLNLILDKTFEKAERKEISQCDKAIQLGFKAFGFRISQEAIAIVAHNNIDKNKELIKDNIRKIVSTEYYKLYSALSAYEIKEVNVATKLREDWIKTISDSIISIIYDGQDEMSRIAHINDKLNIYINDYSTYISNRVFNT